MIQISFVGKDYIAKKLVRKQCLKIARAKSLGEFAIVSAARQRSPANHHELPLAVELNRHCEALQTSMTTIVRDCVRANRTFVRLATERVAKFNVVRRRLQGGTNRVVVGDDQRRGLLTFNQEQGDSR